MSLLRNRKAILAVILLLFAAVGAFTAVKLLSKEDAREFYFRAESNNFKKYSQWLNKNYSLFLESQKPYKTTPYKRRMELTADVTSGGKPFGMENADRLYDLIKRSKLVVDTERKPLDDTAVSNITLLVERVPFIDTTAFTKAGKLCFTIPVLMPEKYFSVDLNNIDAVYDRFSLPVRPKRLVNAADIAQTVLFDEPSFDESASRLGNVFSRLMGKDAVRFGDTKELKISGQSIIGREVLVSLDAAAATELIRGLFTAAASDDELLAFTYGNFADLSAMLDDAGLFRLSEYLDQTGTVILNDNEKKLAGSLNIKKNVDAFRNSLKSAFDGYSVKNGVEMAVVIDNAGNILDRKLTLDLAAKNGSTAIKADIHTGSSNTVFEDCRNRFITVTLTQTDASAQADVAQAGTPDGAAKGLKTEFSLVPDFEKASGADTKGKITLSYALTPQNGAKGGTDIALNFSGTSDAKTLKKNDIIGFKVKMYGSSGSSGTDSFVRESDGSIEGEWNKVSWSNKKLNTTSHTVKLSVNANLPSFGIKDLSAVINLAGEDRLGIGQVVLPEVQQDKITDLNTVSDAELDRIKMEAVASFGTFYFTNKPIFDAILGK